MSYYPRIDCEPCIIRPEYTIRVITHGTKDSIFWNQVQAMSIQAGKDMRINLEFDLYEESTTFDDALIVNDILDVITNNNNNHGVKVVDALIVTIPSRIVKDAVQKAVKSGIPVFGMNSGYEVATSIGLLGHVAMDEYLGGIEAAKEFQNILLRRRQQQQQHQDDDYETNDNNNNSTTTASSSNTTESSSTTILQHLQPPIQAVFINHEKGNSALDLRYQGFQAGWTSTKFSSKNNSNTDHNNNNNINTTAKVIEHVIDWTMTQNDIKEGLQKSLRDCPDVVLLAGSDQLELVTSALFSNGCSISDNTVLLGTFDAWDVVYDAIAVGKVQFAISQQHHLQGSISVILASMYATTGKVLSIPSDGDYGIYLSGPTVITLKNLPSDTLQECEAEAFPVCPNIYAPGSLIGGKKKLARCPCTNRKDITIAGVVHGKKTSGFWNFVMAQSYQAASDAGVTFQMDLLEPQDDTDVYYARMASKISSICQQGVDGMFVTIPNEAVIPSIQECLDLNVPVISINSGASSAIDLGLIHHISQLEYTAGYRGGERFLMEQQQNNNYKVTFGVCVVHEPGNSGLVDRCQGFKDAIVESLGTADAYIDPPVVDEGFYDTDSLYKAAIEDLVSQRPGAIVDGTDDWEGVVIMSPSSGRAPAILELKQVHSKVLVGTFDTKDYIFDSLDSGDMLFAIDQGSFLQGYLPVWLLTYIASTKQNLRNTLIETGPTFIVKAPSDALTVCESNRFEVCKPEVEEDLNQLTRVRPVGYTLCGVVFSVSIGFALWSLIRRNQFYVIQSQPTFLVAVCFGTFILGSAIIPLGIDDSMASIEASSKACMAVPWLVALGFTITFAALFSKLWRINRLMTSARRYKRTNIGSIQAFVPVIALTISNVILLIVWTVKDPMYYKRDSTCEGSSYGVCYFGETKLSKAMFSCVVMINFVALILVTVEAYRARNMSSNLSESKYMFINLAGMLQLGIIGVPIIALVSQDPVASYFVKSILLFLVAMSTLLLTFVPKLIYVYKRHAQETAAGGRSGNVRLSEAVTEAVLGGVPPKRTTMFDSMASSSLRRRSNMSLFGNSASQLGASIHENHSNHSNPASESGPGVGDEVGVGLLWQKVEHLQRLLDSDGINGRSYMVQAGLLLPDAIDDCRHNSSFTSNVQPIGRPTTTSFLLPPVMERSGLSTETPSKDFEAGSRELQPQVEATVSSINKADFGNMEVESME